MKGGKTLSEWPSYRERQPFPKRPREALDVLTHYLRYCANLRNASSQVIRVAVILKSAHLIIPNLGNAVNNDVNAMALLVREWATETALIEHPFAGFLLTENLNDLHSLVVNQPRAAHVRVPLPTPENLAEFFRMSASSFPVALQQYQDDLDAPSSC